LAKIVRPDSCEALRSTPPGALLAWLLLLPTPMASGTATPRPTTMTPTTTPISLRPLRDAARWRRRAPAGPLVNARKTTDSPSVRNTRTKMSAAIIALGTYMHVSRHAPPLGGVRTWERSA
jgi:hypothetical protein